MCRWWKFALCLACLERLLTCFVEAKGGFISFQGRLETEELIFREKNGKRPEWKTYSAEAEVTKFTVIILILNYCVELGLACVWSCSWWEEEKKKAMNTLSSASKYFVTSMKIQEQLCPPDVPNRQNKGVPASSVELKGNKRHSEIETCFFSLSSLPLCPGFWREDHTVPCSVCNRCLQSVCAPSSARDDVNRKQSMSWVWCTFGEKSTATAYTTN